MQIFHERSLQAQVGHTRRQAGVHASVGVLQLPVARDLPVARLLAHGRQVQLAAEQPLMHLVLWNAEPHAMRARAHLLCRERAQAWQMLDKIALYIRMVSGRDPDHKPEPP